MKYVNLTNHEIQVLDDSGFPKVYIEPSGMVARVFGTKVMIDSHSNNIPLYVVEDGSNITCLPPQQNNTIYIVSQIVLRALDGSRADVYAPFLKRHAKSKVKACYGLYKLGEGGVQHVLSDTIK